MVATVAHHASGGEGDGEGGGGDGEGDARQAYACQEGDAREGDGEGTEGDARQVPARREQQRSKESRCAGIQGCAVTTQPCAFTTAPNHSPDRVEVFHGEKVPAILCGYHASAAWLSTALNAMRQTKAEAVNPCRYSVACQNTATTTLSLPIMGQVPACQACAELYARLS